MKKEKEEASLTINQMLGDNSKEVERIEASLDMIKEKISAYDVAITKIQAEKGQLMKTYESNELDKLTLAHKRQMLKQIFVNHRSNKDLDLSNEVRNLELKLNSQRETFKKRLKPFYAKETQTRKESALEELLERQVAALESELECPVCLEVATTSPIYKCADDHLICKECRPKVKRCPQCRETYMGEFRRFRGAERLAELYKNTC